ncbi:MAG: glycosyltransferase, partial [Chlorobiales bacterium]|nr:glycosyltransferase [Chlorobiales bacterium]
MSNHKISIITPTYNSIETIEACILSVASQTLENREHIILDNKSADGTFDIIKKYAAIYPHIHAVSEKDQGIYDALNKGIDLCDGEWIYILGSDDTFYNDDVLSSVFCTHELEQYDVVYGNVEWGKGGTLYDGQFTTLKLLNKNICHQAIFFKRNLFNRFGKFETKYKVLADWVFNMRWFCDKETKILFLNQTFATYNPEGFSSKNTDNIFTAERNSIISTLFPEEYSVIFDLNNKLLSTNNEVNQLITTISQQEQENDSLKTTVDTLYTYIDTLQSRINLLDASINKLQNSSSWRITKPIRKLSNSFRKRSRAIRNIFNISSIANPDQNSVNVHDYSSDFATLYNEFQLSKEYVLRDLEEIIDIIIPVFNEFKRLPGLCKSIIENTSTPYRLFLIDDHSSDEQVYPFLMQFKNEHPQYDIVVLKNKTTIGFLNSINKATQSSKNNFIILNSIGEVPLGWLQKLMHPIIENKSIATTTPFSNDETLRGVSDLLNDDNYREIISVFDIDRFFTNLNPTKKYPDISSGVGFCMGVNKTIFDSIGHFNNKSSKITYGDEAEWCLKAYNKGFRNILIPNLFICHHNDTTSLDLKHNQTTQNKFLQAYPLKEISDLLLMSLLLTDKIRNKRILFVDHDLGGGANLYRNNYVKREL